MNDDQRGFALKRLNKYFKSINLNYTQIYGFWQFTLTAKNAESTIIGTGNTLDDAVDDLIMQTLDELVK